MTRPSCILIGLGSQMEEVYLPALTLTRDVEVLGAVDIDPQKSALAAKFGIKRFSTDIDELIAERTPDFAVVSVPHAEYFNVVSRLIKRGVQVFQEKPLAMNSDEGERLVTLAAEKQVVVHVAMNRRVHPIYWAANVLFSNLGEIKHVEGCFTVPVTDLSQGWRSKNDSSGGGVLLDLGYHAIDLMLWYFGDPVSASAFTPGRARPDQAYDAEDTAVVTLEYAGKHNFRAVLTVSRVYPKRNDGFTVVGSMGSVLLHRGALQHFDRSGTEIESLERRGSWIMGATHQVNAFANAVKAGDAKAFNNARAHLKHLGIIDACYKSARENGIRRLINEEIFS